MPAVFFYMDYVIIDQQEQLETVCAIASRHKAIALDTEFVRTRTLIPQLGLVQLYDGHQLVLIDPLAMDDLTPLTRLLINPKVTKVLHSCSEDLEAFLATFGVTPSPVFDTQFAANVLGLGATIGYARMIEELLQVSLDKGESRTDWLARPLSKNQLRYAADDVLYLLTAFEQIRDMIIARGKYDWVTAEIEVLAKKKMASMPVEFAYLQIKNNWRLSVQQLNVLRDLAAWRLQRARDKNMAVNFVFKESNLFELALRLPCSKTALSRIHGITPQEKRMHGDTVLRIINQALDDFDNTDNHVKPIRRLTDIPEYKQTVANIKRIVSAIAAENGVTDDVIASKKQINQLLKWVWFPINEARVMKLQPELLSGWRAPLFLAKLPVALTQAAS
jgi:ribonuclease D